MSCTAPDTRISVCLILGRGGGGPRPAWVGHLLCRAGSGQSVLVGVVDGLGAVAGAGLCEDVVDVGFDRGVAEDQLAGDLEVGQAGADEGQDFGFSGGERVGQGAGGGDLGAVAQGGRNESLLDLGGKVGLAAVQGQQGLFDLLGGGVLGQVAAGSRLQGREEGVVVGVGGEDQDLGVGEFGADAAGGLGAVQVRHPQVHDDDVGPVGHCLLDSPESVGRGGG